MLSAVIPSERSQPAVLLAEQLAHQRFVRPGPLVLRTALLNTPTRAADRDRTVSRRSKPSSRTALMGEQPNPWDRLQPQDATSRHRTFSAVSGSADYIFTLLFQARGRRVVAVINLPVCRHELPPWRWPQSLRGQSLTRRLPTVLPTAKWRLGVHRYKPIPLRHFCRF